LKPDYAEAHNNLGAALKEMGRLEGAEASYNQAIALKSDYVEVHYNLGITLQELGRLDEAEASLRQAIALKPNHADAHSQLGINSYSKGNIDAAIESLKKARDIDPKSGLSSLVLPVLRARKARESTEVGFDNKKKADHDLELSSNPLRLNRVVEPELVSALLEMQSRDMDKARNTPVFGNGRCSLDYNMFDVSSPIIKAVEKDLVNLLEAAFKSKIYLADSFFNIYAAGAGIPPHTHLAELDKNEYLSLAKQKFSLVYYLSVGDQDCSEPGVFKLYDPEEEILPCDGMILIIPAGRRHSAVYGGKKDRVIIGINFYSL
jgi:tetratricopeptide (TPR) repeat protein